MLQASVTNVELFRTWLDEESLDLAWLLRRIRGEEPPTEAMLAGRAFHEALECLNPAAQDVDTLTAEEYRFDFNCAAEIPVAPVREIPIEKQYGNLLVRGRVDAWLGIEIVDYKSTGQFDPDRLMDGFQWRFYLDMTGADLFTWKVFLLREFGAPGNYEVFQFHTLQQKRYPNLHADCERLAWDYVDVLSAPLSQPPQPVVAILDGCPPTETL